MQLHFSKVMRSDALKKIVLTEAFPLEAGGGKTDRMKAPHEWIEGRPELLPSHDTPCSFSLSLSLTEKFPHDSEHYNRGVGA